MRHMFAAITKPLQLISQYGDIVDIMPIPAAEPQTDTQVAGDRREAVLL